MSIEPVFRGVLGDCSEIGVGCEFAPWRGVGMETREGVSSFVGTAIVCGEYG